MSAGRVSVSTDNRGRPVRFAHLRRVRRVQQLLDEWEEAGCWWQGEAPRRVYRVLTMEGTVCELHHHPPAGWRLVRTYD